MGRGVVGPLSGESVQGASVSGEPVRSESMLSGIGALADPGRHRLYRYVCAQPEPVGRDQAAQALGVARHQAKFHLDRLAAEGLLDVDYVRMTGRTGPGAGRPAKRYRRSSSEFAVSVPAREYELAGQVMADAISESARTGRPIREAVDAAAAARGRLVAAGAGQAETGPQALDELVTVLARYGYEPRRVGGAVQLANCPFHRLAESQTELVCQLNHALLAAAADTIAPGALQTRLDPGEGRCCVTVAVSTHQRGEGEGER